MSGKDHIIRRQHKVMVAQREQILHLQQMQVEFSKLALNPDVIKLDGIQKVRELEAEDRYKVLEFLVREMMDIKDQLPHRRQYYDGRHDTPISEVHPKERRSTRKKENKDLRNSGTSIKVT